MAYKKLMLAVRRASLRTVSYTGSLADAMAVLSL